MKLNYTYSVSVPVKQNVQTKQVLKNVNKTTPRFYAWYLYYLSRLQSKLQSRPPLKPPTPPQVYKPKTHVCFDKNRHKLALVLGINYNDDSELKLNGCINDTVTVRNLLKSRFGYKDSDITVITDDTSVKPTRKNIEDALETLVQRVLRDNITELFISFSGHGTYLRDTGGDEDDGKDEAIVPLDCKTKGVIKDDDLHGKYLSRLPANVNVFSLMDCCHSGTILDLEYKYNHTGGAFNSGTWKSQLNKKLNAKVLKISGCRDDQYSADAFIDGKYCGAMTSSLEKTVGVSKDCRELLLNMTNYLKNNKFDQRPVLTSSFTCNREDKLLIV
jgi:metacaspase-1